MSSSSGHLADELNIPPPELSEVLRQFVTVKLTDAQQIDLARMPFQKYQDPDQSWWCWVLSPEGQVYSVLGKESPTSPEFEIGEAVNWMTSVLNHHWDPRRADWDADGEAIPDSTPIQSVTENPGYNSWKEGATYLGNIRDSGKCMCCHQVQDVFWSERNLSQKFQPSADYWIWPPAESAGIILKSQADGTVTEVLSNTPADRSLLKAGDRIGVIDQQRVFSSADIRASLNQVAEFEFYVAQDQNISRYKFPERATHNRGHDITWRTSIEESVLGSHPGFLLEPASKPVRSKLELEGRMALRPLVGNDSPAWKAGVRSNQVIVRLEEMGEDFTPKQFMVAFKMTAIGSKSSITVRNLDNPGLAERIELEAISILDLPPEAIQMMKELK